MNHRALCVTGADKQNGDQTIYLDHNGMLALQGALAGMLISGDETAAFIGFRNGNYHLVKITQAGFEDFDCFGSRCHCGCQKNFEHFRQLDELEAAANDCGASI